MVHIRRSRRSSVALAGAVVVIALVATGCSSSPSTSNSENLPFPTGPNGDRPGIGREVNVVDEPASTFAIDIDTASYNYARRQLQDHSRVDPSTVRPEEFVNAFKQDYPQPSGQGFSVNVDGAHLPSTHHLANGGGEVRLMRVGLQTRAEDSGERKDAALTFVVDVSGSMSEAGRLDLVQDAMHTLIDQLRPSDSVAIVAYEDKARVLREMTPARNRSALHAAVDDLAPGGSTNLEAGLVTGYRVARDGFVTGASNRVILLSDGLANVGNTTAEPILAQIREEASKQIALLGVGVGSDYGDALMERLADAGDGLVTYISDRAQARELFVTRLPATLTVRALDAKVQVVFDESNVDSYRLIGYENRTLSASQFENDRVDGGEVGPGHSVTALYVVRLRSERRGEVAEVRVRWLDPSTRAAQERAAAITTDDLSQSFTQASPRFRVCYVAAYFAEILRRSSYGSEVSAGDLSSIARTAYAATDDSQVDELSELVRSASD